MSRLWLVRHGAVASAVLLTLCPQASRSCLKLLSSFAYSSTASEFNTRLWGIDIRGDVPMAAECFLAISPDPLCGTGSTSTLLRMPLLKLIHTGRDPRGNRGRGIAFDQEFDA